MQPDMTSKCLKYAIYRNFLLTNLGEFGTIVFALVGRTTESALERRFAKLNKPKEFRYLEKYSSG